MIQNKLVYTLPQVVKKYSTKKELQPAEKQILQKYYSLISGSVMLDLGVGTGRTTPFFSEICKEYYGTDYSFTMIKECKRKFKNLAFYVMDTRKLSFPDNYFDFVLYSFNGLDYVNLAGRLKSLQQINRVLKPNGLFVFSTHNLRSVIINPKQKFKIIKDGVFRNTIKTFYILPEKAVEQVNNFGFEVIDAYENKGKRIDLKSIKETKSTWVYFVCRKVGVPYK